MNDNEKYLEEFVKDVPFDAPDDKHRDVLKKQLMNAFPRHRLQQTVHTVKIWRTTMKNQIAKLAAAAVIIVAVLIGLYQFGSSIDIASVTFAEVVENIRHSKTLTFVLRAKEQEPPMMKVMVMDPYVSRFEFLGEHMPSTRVVDGNIWIVDTRTGKALVLNTVKRTGKVHPASKETLDIYNTFINFRDRVDFSVEEIGSRQIGDKQAVGFKLEKENENHEIIVWADPETKLPILIEEIYEDAEGQSMQHVVTDIVFDAGLDESLFSLRPPEGYKMEEFEYDPPVKRLISATNMNRIMKACRKYVDEHNGQWPNNLEELTTYGLDGDVFLNPGQPAGEVSYVYLKPPVSPAKSRIVLHEAYDVWNGGINVAFADYHIGFIKEESDFKNHLGKNGQ